MRARAMLTGAIIAQGCLFASAVVVTQTQEPLAPSEVTREAPVGITALPPPTEAPAAFELVTNGAVDATRFAASLEEFTGPEGAADGLGPVFNGVGCAECHATPMIGGSSQVVERRAGNFNGTTFTEHPGGSLIQDRSLFPELQERVLPGNNVIAFRASLSILGLGFVEAIDSNTIAAIAQSQPASVRGQLIQVPVLESGGATRFGRFGWKNQQASLLSFASDAYLNEQGVEPVIAGGSHQRGDSRRRGQRSAEHPEGAHFRVIRGLPASQRPSGPRKGESEDGRGGHQPGLARANCLKHKTHEVNSLRRRVSIGSGRASCDFRAPRVRVQREQHTQGFACVQSGVLTGNRDGLCGTGRTYSRA